MHTLVAHVWVAAAFPALVWGTVVCVLMRRVRDPWAVTIAAVLAGAVLAAWPASHISQALHDRFGDLASKAAGYWLVPGVVVPTVEEMLKAASLLLLSVLPHTPRLDVMRGMRRGALIGIGFAMLENTQYLTFALLQGNISGLWRAAYVRGLIGSLSHAIYAATVGAGIGAAFQASTSSARCIAVGIGFAAAVAQHVVWNTAAAGAITDALCHPMRIGGPCRLPPDLFDMFVTTPLIAALALGPGVIVLLLVSARTARNRS